LVAFSQSTAFTLTLNHEKGKTGERRKEDLYSLQDLIRVPPFSILLLSPRHDRSVRVNAVDCCQDAEEKKGAEAREPNRSNERNGAKKLSLLSPLLLFVLGTIAA